MKKIGSLELDDDMRHHQLFWRLKRIGWILMALLVFTAFAGYTGGGWSSEREIINEGIAFTYQKIARRSALAKMYIKSDVSGKDTLAISFDNNYMRDIMIESINPEPIETITAGATMTFKFLTNRNESEAEVTFFVRPDKHGNMSFNVTSNGTKVSVKQLIFP